ncbi:hypothetical protein [Halalkalibacterium ligniniphilum]|uniref:hypothetical protein n=1 Tax=Halalkalibacterium ligniniphilum TaxID=1134413 RepID=UPI00034C39A0|nr:hypothetical protein [Halalkalibacterium ligniniphilum]
MTRWVTIRPYLDIDKELLTRIVIHPEGVNKQEIRAEYGEYMQERNVLIKRGDRYEFKE